MRKQILLSPLLLLFACNTGDTNNSTASDSSTNSSKAALIYSSPITYSSQFEMGDNKNAQLILDLWKDFDNNTLNNSKDKFADTVRMLFSETEMTGNRDSIFNATQSYRNMFNTVSSRVGAIMPVKSTDKDEDWVLVWGTETHTDKNNKTDSVHLQETWRINKDGKVDFMMQYLRIPPPAKK